MAALIRLKSVGKRFAGAGVALREVSLEVAQGELVAVVGASGSGKTTLLKAINRLVAVDGEIEVEGEAVAAADPAGLRRRIGYVFQGIGLFPHLSVAENIGVTPRLLGWPREKIAARVNELLDLVALPREMASRAPAALSGGQQQRVGLARALAAGPKIMLMDEPFGALDPITRDELTEAYRDLHHALSLTTLVVTHDMQEAVLLADRILVMADGELIADGAPAQLLASSDPRVADLIAMPRRQAERIQAKLAGAGA
jgi:osmoprotectant transport system ATP-binding protein